MLTGGLRSRLSNISSNKLFSSSSLRTSSTVEVSEVVADWLFRLLSDKEEPENLGGMKPKLSEETGLVKDSHAKGCLK